MKRTVLLSVFLWLPCGMLRAQSLLAHNVQATLARVVKDPQVEYLVEDLHTHEVLADSFARPAQGMPVGSLLKPFLAYAYGGSPAVVCHGKADGCWRPGGHGRLTLRPALAVSCNAYFLALAARLTAADRARIGALGLPPVPPDATPATLIGLRGDWLVSPLQLADGYARLLPVASAEELAGLRDAARRGTAVRVGTHPGGVLAKTGTAPCLPALSRGGCRASGDGLAVAMVPALQPTLLVLVRRRGTNGATTAATAGEILSSIELLRQGRDAR